VAADLAEIEAGRRTELIGHYPRELRGLTDNLNALIRHERSHLERYRHTLDDLAHSLKTPLAVLRGTLDSGGSNQEFQHSVQEQVDRMSQIVQYQLQRAATSGRTTLTAPIALLGAVQKITASLDKVYAGKQVTCRLRIDDKAFFHGDEGDLLELLGNLLDNAYKSCRQHVVISGQPLVDHRYSTGLIIYVEDDGPGIPLDMAQSVLQRGVRMDTATPGQGIGLAVVQDIVRIYKGALEIGSSHLGGARLTVHLPGD
jgi:two-component system sensor histidine kinase PhoQ